MGNYRAQLTAEWCGSSSFHRRESLFLSISLISVHHFCQLLCYCSHQRQHSYCMHMDIYTVASFNPGRAAFYCSNLRPYYCCGSEWLKPKWCIKADVPTRCPTLLLDAVYWSPAARLRAQGWCCPVARVKCLHLLTTEAYSASPIRRKG